jgi:hypothetical protein
MFTFTIEDLKILQDVYDGLTGSGYEYDIPSIVQGNILDKDLTVEEATKDAIGTFMTLSTPDMLSFAEYAELENLIFNMPLEDMPLFINVESNKKRAAAAWRLRIGK